MDLKRIVLLGFSCCILFIPFSATTAHTPNSQGPTCNLPQDSGTFDVQAELEAASIFKQAFPSKQSSLVVQLGDLIYFSDFEADGGGLIGTLDWTYGTYAWSGSTCFQANPLPPAAAYSGINMWGTRLNDCYQNLGNNQGSTTCINEVPTDNSILSFAVDLTGYDDAVLSWWEWYDLFMPWDWAEVRVNDLSVFQHCGSDYVIPTAWVQQTVDLTPFAGGTVNIELHMMASTVVNYTGWFIDDVMITGTPVVYEIYLPVIVK